MDRKVYKINNRSKDHIAVSLKKYPMGYWRSRGKSIANYYVGSFFMFITYLYAEDGWKGEPIFYIKYSYIFIGISIAITAIYRTIIGIKKGFEVYSIELSKDCAIIGDARMPISGMENFFIHQPGYISNDPVFELGYNYNKVSVTGPFNADGRRVSRICHG